ncbi:hypothetical protein [Catenulispora subtropica]|uniref:hypothetical protein n=1 Tax=Catenulispora subtropica TaxID=450798 RepID=UPI0031D05D39
MTETEDGAGFAGPGRPERAEVFEVWRQDDNGNRFLMSRHPDRASAEAAVAAMEAGVQHKQLYFVVERSAQPE